MTEKTWVISYLDGTPSLKVKAVEKVKDMLSYADLSGADFSCANLKAANLRGANLIRADLIEAKGLPGTRLTLTQQIRKKRKRK